MRNSKIMTLKLRRPAGSLALIAVFCFVSGDPPHAQTSPSGVPIFQVDASWPKFDGNWIFGSIGGVFVDPTNDHVWVLNRPRTVQPDENYAAQNPPVADCCVPPPFVMEFTEDGKFVKGWGGPAPVMSGPRTSTASQSIPKAISGSRRTAKGMRRF